MQATLLYQLTGEPNSTEIESRLGDGLPAIDANATRYLDGRTLYHGEAAAQIETEERVPTVTDDAIFHEKEPVSQYRSCEWFVDFEKEWAGIDTSDGEFFFDLLVQTHGVRGEKVEVGLAAWARDFIDWQDAHVWGMSYSEGDEETTVRAGADFHKDASKRTLRQQADDVAAVGFSYIWDGARARGIISESGYVAIYSNWTAEQFGRWLASEVLPYTVYDATAADQTTLGQGGENDD